MAWIRKACQSWTKDISYSPRLLACRNMSSSLIITRDPVLCLCSTLTYCPSSPKDGPRRSPLFLSPFAPSREKENIWHSHKMCLQEEPVCWTHEWNHNLLPHTLFMTLESLLPQVTDSRHPWIWLLWLWHRQHIFSQPRSTDNRVPCWYSWKETSTELILH